MKNEYIVKICTYRICSSWKKILNENFREFYCVSNEIYCIPINRKNLRKAVKSYKELYTNFSWYDFLDTIVIYSQLPLVVVDQAHIPNNNQESYILSRIKSYCERKIT